MPLLSLTAKDESTAFVNLTFFKSFVVFPSATPKFEKNSISAVHPEDFF